MADVFTASGARNPKPGLVANPGGALSGGQIMAPYTAISEAVGFLGHRLEEATIPFQEAAGAKAVEMDADGNVKVNARWGEFTKGDRAYNAAARQAGIAMQGVQLNEDLQGLRMQFDGKPAEFQAAAKDYLRTRAKGTDPLLRSYVEAEGAQVASQHFRGLMADKERLDTARFAKDLDARENQLVGRVSNLAEQGGTDTPEFTSAMSELQDLRNQRAANPKFTYSPEQARIDNENTGRSLQAIAITGIARRDYEKTGDLDLAQRKAEEGLRSLGLPPDQVQQHLGQISRNLAGASAARTERLNDLEERGRAAVVTMQMGGKVDPREMQEIVSGLQAGRRHSAARSIELSVAGVEGARDIEGARSAADLVGALKSPTGRVAASPVDVARNFEGLTESGHAAVLTEFFKKTGGAAIDPSRVAWCAAFVDACLKASGKEGLGSLRAADFLKYGAATDKPTQGDVVVFKPQARGASGHVGIVVSIEGDKVRYIAGNDGNKVQETTLPVSEVMGFRVPPQSGEGISLPAESQRRGEVIAYGATDLASLTRMKARQDAYDKRFDTALGELEKADYRPSQQEISDIVQLAPHVADPKLRGRAMSWLQGRAIEAQVSGTPLGEIEGTINALRSQEQAEGLPPVGRDLLKAYEKSYAERTKVLDEAPYRVAGEYEFGADKKPIVNAASQPVDWSQPQSVAASFQARSETSRLLETYNQGRVGARSLIQKDEVPAFKAALQQSDPTVAMGVFSALASGRAENMWATLEDRDVRSTLSNLTNTTDPAKYSAAMSGLDQIYRRDPAKFIDMFGKEALAKMEHWERELAYATPETLAKKLSNRAAIPSETRNAMVAEAHKFAGKKEAGDIMNELRGAMEFGDRTSGDPTSRMAFMDEYRQLLEETYVETGNMEAAHATAVKTLGAAWKTSDVNGGRLMKHAPEQHYPTVNGSHSWMAEQLQTELQARLGLKPQTLAGKGGAVTVMPDPVQYTLVATPETQADITAGSKTPRYRVLYTDPNDGRIKDALFQFDPSATPELKKQQAYYEDRRKRDAEGGALYREHFGNLNEPLETLNRQREE